MRAKPVHIWWIGVGLFAPSCTIWAYFSVLIIWRFGRFGSLDLHGVTHTYLPLLAAMLGLGVPFFFLRHFRKLSTNATLTAFLVYLVLMLTWGVFDIRGERYQIGGHDYPNGIVEDGHRHYWHLYFTWYFLPYKWIHGYNFD